MAKCAPHPREAVGLQLHADRKGVLGRLPSAPALARHLLRDAELVLDVVADLMRDDVGPGEVTGRAEALLQLLEERQVEVHLAVARAVERSDRGVGHPARGVDGVPEEHQLGRRVAAPHLVEEPAPGVLGVAEHLGHELLVLVAHGGAGPRRGRRGLLRRGREPAAARQHAQDLERILAEQEAQDDDRDEAGAADLEPAAPIPPRRGDWPSRSSTLLLPRMSCQRMQRPPFGPRGDLSRTGERAGTRGARRKRRARRRSPPSRRPDGRGVEAREAVPDGHDVGQEAELTEASGPERRCPLLRCQEAPVRAVGGGRGAASGTSPSG